MSMVKLTVSPTFGAELSTNLNTARSDDCGVTVAVSLLLPEFGSNWSEWLMVAVLVWAAELTPRLR